MKCFSKQQLKYDAIVASLLSIIVSMFVFLDLVFLEDIIKGCNFKEVLLGIAMVVGVNALLFLIFFLRWKFTKYEIGKDSIRLKRFLSRRVIEIYFLDIQKIKRHRTILQKIFRLSSLGVYGMNAKEKIELFVIILEDKEVEQVIKQFETSHKSIH